MRQRDSEMRLDGPGHLGSGAETRRIGERLLLMDELEDTLEQVRTSGEAPERIHALERRLSAEREMIQAIQRRGELRYDEIARAMGRPEPRG